MGALVTLDLPDDSPMVDLPWIITFGPLDDVDEWEPVVCGPYERPHALAVAEAVVADEDLMAVVEPLLPAVSVDEIRAEIDAARAAAEDEAAEADDAGLYADYDPVGDEEPELIPAGEPAGSAGSESELLTGPAPTSAGGFDGTATGRQPRVPPSESDLRAGFARIAELLTGRGGAGPAGQASSGPR